MPSSYGTGGGGNSMQGTGGSGGSVYGTIANAFSSALGTKGADTEQDKATLNKLNQLFDEAKKARQPFDMEAWLNVAFFNNEQYVEFPDPDEVKSNRNLSDLALRRIPRKADEEHLPRPVFNKIQHYIYTAHSETLQDKPSIDALPANDDYQAAMDADVNKAYLNYVMEPTVANWDYQLSDATLWALIAPAGWLKWTWNPSLRRPDIIPVSYFDTYVDPFAKQFMRARHVIHTMFLSKDDVEDTFSIKLDSADEGITDELRVELLRSMGSTPIANGIEVRELWMKPNTRHPRGMYALWTPRRILKIEDKLPYTYLQQNGGMLPFTMLGSLRRPDALFYTSPVTALRPAQMVWNKFIAQAIMMNENFAAPKWWIPEELELQQMPNSSPHQVLKGRSGQAQLKPEILTPPGMGDNSRLLDVFEQQMMHVVSVHEVSQGQVPGRVEAAKAIELLKSSDEGRYKHLLDTIDQAISVGGYQILQMAKEFESPTKQVLTYSKEGAAIVKQWRAEAVQPGLQVRAVRMNGLGRTRAQRADTLMLLWQNKIITDPDVMARLMDVPFPSFTDPSAMDMRLARAENIEMSKKIAVVPNSWDNHAVHLREHNSYRKTHEFRALGPLEKTMFEFHCQRHEQLQIMEAQKMAVLMAAQQPPMPGAAPAPPGAVSPSNTEAPPEGSGGTPPPTS